MNQYLHNLNRLEFVVTMACTGSCKHCSQGKIKNSAVLDKHIASDAVRAVAAEYDIKSVMTFGGEALLYPDTVCEIHRAAAELNIPKRQLITNGYFSNDTDVIRSVAEKITKCGVNEILLSVDAFHQETIPVDKVMLFAEYVLESSIDIKVHPAWLVSSDNENPYNTQTKELLSQFSKMGIEISSGNVVFPAGNALEYLAEYFDFSKPVANPYSENPNDIRAICVSADGSLLGGNINSQNINSILAAYKP